MLSFAFFIALSFLLITVIRIVHRLLRSSFFISHFGLHVRIHSVLSAHLSFIPILLSFVVFRSPFIHWLWPHTTFTRRHSTSTFDDISRTFHGKDSRCMRVLRGAVLWRRWRWRLVSGRCGLGLIGRCVYVLMKYDCDRLDADYDRFGLWWSTVMISPGAIIDWTPLA